MQTQIEKKEKGICDIVGCENEATVRGQTMRFCYEHYCKITANDGSDSTIENEEFFVGSHKIKKVTRKHLEKVKDDQLLDILCGTSEVRVNIEGEDSKRFLYIKKHFGLKNDEDVLRRVINEVYEAMSKEKEKVTAKRVDVPMDADLLAEAKKHNVNIEEATMQHLKELQEQYPGKKA